MEILQCDVLVLGGGGAGARAAIEAQYHGASVILVARSRVGQGGCTPVAVGGGASDREDPDSHYQDTMASGQGLSDPALARILADEAPDRIDDVISYGANFRPGVRSRTPGHSHARNNVFGARGGKEITMALRRELARREIARVEDVAVISLVTENGTVRGAVGVGPKGIPMAFSAGATVLALGGCGALYEFTTNPRDMVGEGFALAYQAGAELRDMEFIQFYPTAMVYPVRGPIVLNSLLPMGAKLLNGERRSFMEKYDSRGEDATRDSMSQAIYMEIRDGNAAPHGGVYMDLTSIPEEGFQRYPHFADLLRRRAADPSRIEVSPAAHFALGGVRIGEWGDTTVEGLYAAGEIAGGLHGVNRLAGNAISETQVFGRRAGLAAAQYALGRPRLGAIHELPLPPNDGARTGIPASRVKTAIRRTIWQCAGIVRARPETERGLEAILELRAQLPKVYPDRTLGDALQLEPMLTVAEMILRCALERTESRGAHLRSDHREKRSSWDRTIIVSRAPSGDMALRTTPAAAPAPA